MTTETKPQPSTGPAPQGVEWRVDIQGRGYCIRIHAPHYTGRGEMLAQHIERAEDARVLAAAPDLLAALQNFIRLDQSSPRDKSGNRVFVDVRDWEAFLATARDAIKYSTGSASE